MFLSGRAGALQVKLRKQKFKVRKVEREIAVEQSEDDPWKGEHLYVGEDGSAVQLRSEPVWQRQCDRVRVRSLSWLKSVEGNEGRERRR